MLSGEWDPTLLAKAVYGDRLFVQGGSRCSQAGSWEGGRRGVPIGSWAEGGEGKTGAAQVRQQQPEVAVRDRAGSDAGEGLRKNPWHLWQTGYAPSLYTLSTPFAGVRVLPPSHMLNASDFRDMG